MRRTCRGVAAVVVAIAALACQPPVRPAADLRTPWRRMADSTAVLMHGVVSSADTASVQAMLALSDTASARWRGTLARARARPPRCSSPPMRPSPPGSGC